MKKIACILLSITIQMSCHRMPLKKEAQNKLKNLYTLPTKYNTPDGAAMGKDGKIYISVPNFNNGYLLENNIIQKPEPSYIITLDEKNQLSEWYQFGGDVLHPKTQFVGPMDLAFGPDGNLYVADMQLAYDPMHQSRILRINILNGKPIGVDVVVEGFIACNGLIWHENTLYVTESILAHVPDTEENSVLHSGVYAFSMEELQSGKTIQLEAFTTEKSDPHLAVHLKTPHTGFGADGIAFDDKGYLYTTAGGAIYKTLLDVANRELETNLFAQNRETMISADGLIWNPKDRKLYTPGFLENALYAIDESGQIEKLHQNGDTNGEEGLLDQPAEVILRGDELIIVNMDLGGYSKEDLNTKPDEPYTISSYDLSDVSRPKISQKDRALSEDLYTIFVTVKVKEGYKHKMKESLVIDVEGAQKEKGNLLMELYEDRNISNTLYLYEKWENRQALWKHFELPHTQQAFKAGEKYGAGVEFLYLKAILPVSEKEIKLPDAADETVDLFIEFTVKENLKEKFLEKMFKSIRMSRQEKGNIAFQLYKVRNHSSKFVLRERWRNQEVLDAHLQKSYTKELLEIFPEVLAVPLHDGKNYTEALKQVSEVLPLKKMPNR